MGKPITGREKEQKILNDVLVSDESELIAIYGRRRVGKTFLIRESYKTHIVFDMTGIKGAKKKIQLRNFQSQLKNASTRFKNVAIPKDWFEAFDLLKEYLDNLTSKKKKVIFIDEFPWLCSQRSDFLMLFEHFWNDYCTKRTDLLVVVCGSAASFMVQNIVHNQGGLHGRISRTIQLMPFNLYETREYLRKRGINWVDYDIIQIYMAIGGIPYYLKQLNKAFTVPQNIDQLCFAMGGVMVNEFDEVLISLFTNSALHKLIITTLATKRKGLTRKRLIELSKKPDNGDFSDALRELEESGFVAKYRAFDNANHKILYRLSDEFCYFYLKFMKSNAGQGAGTWVQLFSKQTNKSWSGFAFETVCLKHIQEIKKALGVHIMHTVNSSWDNGHAQVDLVIDRDDNRIDLCEMKFYKEPFDIKKDYYADLLNKISEFKADNKTKNKNVVIIMVTTYGVKNNKYKTSIVTGNLVMDILFEKL
jgi:uncharacterized protein